MLVDVVFKRGLILENASGNLVFLQLDKDGNRIGAEVIGTHPDKDGNRIRLNMPGSKGFFYILGKDCDSLKRCRTDCLLRGCYRPLIIRGTNRLF